MQDSQSENYSSNKSLQVEGQNYLAVMCPACGKQHIHYLDGASCECLQPLDPEVHKLEVMRERWEQALRPIAAKRLRDFLVELANMQVRHEDDVDGAARLVKRFPEFFPAPYPDDSYWAKQARQFRQGDISPDEIRKWSLQPLIAMSNDLRRLWEMKRSDLKDWRLYRLRERVWAITAHPSIQPGVFRRRLEEGPPPQDGLQQALLYFHARSYIARTCREDCKTLPYFFAEKSNQQHCSEPCARAAQSDAKQRWWRTKGNEWRKAHTDNKKKKKSKK